MSANGAWQAGERIGPYVLVSPKGSGGMGAVWEAESPSGQRVALKLMHSHLADDADLIRRFRREYEVGVNVRHPNLVEMLDSGVIDGIPYLVMQLAEGKPIRRLIERGGPFREGDVAAMGAQIANGLAALNLAGVVHRDIKASNIVVDRRLHVIIIDYGIARVEGERTITEAGSFIGSAEYSSPEPYLGRKPDARSDVYSVGIVMYELLTGKVPYRSDRYTDTLRMHAELPVPRVSEREPMVSRGMDDLVYSMLQKQPARRPTAEQVAEACRAISYSHGRSAPAPNQQPANVPRSAPVPQPSPSMPLQPMPSYEDPDGDTSNRAAIAVALAAAVGAAIVFAAVLAAVVAS